MPGGPGGPTAPSRPSRPFNPSRPFTPGGPVGPCKQQLLQVALGAMSPSCPLLETTTTILKSRASTGLTVILYQTTTGVYSQQASILCSVLVIGISHSIYYILYILAIGECDALMDTPTVIKKELSVKKPGVYCPIPSTADKMFPE